MAARCYGSVPPDLREHEPMPGQAAATLPPSKITPPDQPLSPWRLVRTVVRNPIEAWPKPVYEQPLYRSRVLGRETVFVTDPDLVRQVLVDQADAFVKAESLRRALQPLLGDAVLTADGARWRWQRQAAAPIFRPDQIRGFVPAMVAAAERRRALWLSRVGEEVNVAQEMMHTTFDIIAATMLSGQGRADVSRVEQAFTDHLNPTSWAIALILLRAPRWMPYPGRRRAERARDYLRGEVARIVSERRHGDQAYPDLITRLLKATDPETGRAMSDRDVVDNVLTFITAGHETTALALTWTFYLLSLHPEIEERAVQEVEAVTKGGTLREGHVEALSYTRQVVLEAMRLYPPAPVVVRTATRDVNRVVRSTRVPIAELPSPRMRSPSQARGPARSAASAGRLLGRISRVKDLLPRPRRRARGTWSARPVRMQAVSAPPVAPLVAAY